MKNISIIFLKNTIQPNPNIILISRNILGGNLMGVSDMDLIFKVDF